MIGHEPGAGEQTAPVVTAPAPAGSRATPAGTPPTEARDGGVAVRLEHLHKSFGPCRAVDGVTLDVRDGELLAILGPSGCGKSTLLRLVAGLERQDQGRVVLHGRDVGALPPAARACGVVFQSYALFPNLTAAENVAFGIDRRHGRRARAARAAALLEQVGLAGETRRYPAQLSGGQQQRVALARALATEPSLLLLDEPLSALDAKVRAMLRVEIRRLQQATRLTTLLVTHDQEEAMTMADRVAVMNGGRLVQVDSPRAVYQRPADAFTAAFVGVMNLLDGWTVGAGATLRRGELILRTSDPSPARVGARVTVAFRPEAADLSALHPPARGENGAAENVLPCTLERSEFRGPSVRHYLSLRGDSGEVIVADMPAREERLESGPGGLVGLHVPPDAIRVFGDGGAAR